MNQKQRVDVFVRTFYINLQGSVDSLQMRSVAFKVLIRSGLPDACCKLY